MYREDRTFIALPGPVEIHPRVYTAMNQHVYGHRTKHFKQIYSDCVNKFQETINTSGEVQFHAGSGSLGLHAAISNLVNREDHVVNLVNGKFGERVEKISSRFTKNAVSIKAKYGKAIKPEEVESYLDKNPKVDLVTLTHNETSTGVLNPLPEISKVVHNHGALLMADCITSAGGDLVKMDDWQIDFFVSGSQKCYGLPPGLAFIAYNESAEEKMKSINRNQDFYSDLLDFQSREIGNTPFTPAVSLIYGLQTSLDLILEEGIDERIARHREMGRLYRGAMQNLGLVLFAEENYRSNTVTTTKVPVKADSGKLSETAKDLGILIAGGQGKMKGKVFRIGHMNLVGSRELLMIVSVLEIALKKAGASIQLGEGIRTIQEGIIKG